jgi:hypothetical protein
LHVAKDNVEVLISVDERAGHIVESDFEFRVDAPTPVVCHGLPNYSKDTDDETVAHYKGAAWLEIADPLSRQRQRRTGALSSRRPKSEDIGFGLPQQPTFSSGPQ